MTPPGSCARGVLTSSRARIVIVALLAVAALSVSNMPSTTNVLVDYAPQTVTQPLYAKAISFIDRDIQMRQLAGRVVGDAAGAEEKAERIMSWTNANIRRRPSALPAIDDHPYNTIVRGYGDVDQMADVFANIAAYAGIDGGLVRSVGDDGSMLYAFAVLRIDSADRLFDVAEGRAFRDRSGALAAVEDLPVGPSIGRRPRVAPAGTRGPVHGPRRAPRTRPPSPAIGSDAVLTSRE